MHVIVELRARCDGIGARSKRLQADAEKPLKPLKSLFSSGTPLVRLANAEILLKIRIRDDDIGQHANFCVVRPRQTPVPIQF